MEIGTRVVRITGGQGYKGDIGTIVELSGDRVRVRWDSQPNRKGKRTWICVSAVKRLATALDTTNGGMR